MKQEIQRVKAPEGGFALWWLAQAGFVFKTHAGTIVYVDPYLSNVVEKAFGFKRLSLPPIAAEAVDADFVFCSHEHLDHMDTDSLPVIAANNSGCRFAGPVSCAPEFAKMEIVPPRFTLLEYNRDYIFADVRVRTARADHGEISPSALSLLLDAGQVRVLLTGDTCLNIPWMQTLLDAKPDVFVPCINGRFGNLDAEQAAGLTALAAPRAVIPCHFWMFKEHNGDPESFVQACAAHCPETPVVLLRPGQGVLCKKDAVELIGTL